MAVQEIRSFTMQTIEGEQQALSTYEGKVLFIVNVASRCGFTPQYEGLEALYRTYKDQGLVVLGFPSNDFMNQEPGTDQEIQQFCSLKYDVTFPMFSKISVKGKAIHPLYDYLTNHSEIPGPISWNFNKILVNRSGQVVGRWGSRIDPRSKELVKKLEATLQAQ